MLFQQSYSLIKSPKSTKGKFHRLLILHPFTTNTKRVAVTTLGLITMKKVRRLVLPIRMMRMKASHQFQKSPNPYTMTITSLLQRIIPLRVSGLIVKYLTPSEMKLHPMAQPQNPFYLSSLSFMTKCDSRSNVNPTHAQPFAILAFLALIKRLRPKTPTSPFTTISPVNLSANLILYFILGNCDPFQECH